MCCKAVVERDVRVAPVLCRSGWAKKRGGGKGGGVHSRETRLMQDSEGVQGPSKSGSMVNEVNG